MTPLLLCKDNNYLETNTLEKFVLAKLGEIKRMKLIRLKISRYGFYKLLQIPVGVHGIPDYASKKTSGVTTKLTFIWGFLSLSHLFPIYYEQRKLISLSITTLVVV